MSCSSRVEVLAVVSDQLDKQAVYTDADELGYFKTKVLLPFCLPGTKH